MQRHEKQTAKPSYSPAWSSARRVDISADLAAAMKAGEQ
jgi:hypothetical protein